MSGRIISQRHLSDCSLLVTTRATPEQAYAIVGRHFPDRAEPRPMRFRVGLEPLGLFVLDARIVESAGGSNVYVCVAARLLHALALAMMFWLFLHDGTAWLLPFAALIATIAAIKVRALRIAVELAQELPLTARR